MWPLLTGANTTQPRPLTPVTEVSIVDTSDSAHCERQTIPPICVFADGDSCLAIQREFLIDGLLW